MFVAILCTFNILSFFSSYQQIISCLEILLPLTDAVAEPSISSNSSSSLLHRRNFADLNALSASQPQPAERQRSQQTPLNSTLSFLSSNLIDIDQDVTDPQHRSCVELLGSRSLFHSQFLNHSASAIGSQIASLQPQLPLTQFYLSLLIHKATLSEWCLEQFTETFSSLNAALASTVPLDITLLKFNATISSLSPILLQSQDSKSLLSALTSIFTTLCALLGSYQVETSLLECLSILQRFCLDTRQPLYQRVSGVDPSHLTASVKRFLASPTTSSQQHPTLYECTLLGACSAVIHSLSSAAESPLIVSLFDLLQRQLNLIQLHDQMSLHTYESLIELIARLFSCDTPVHCTTLVEAINLVKRPPTCPLVLKFSESLQNRCIKLAAVIMSLATQSQQTHASVVRLRHSLLKCVVVSSMLIEQLPSPVTMSKLYHCARTTSSKASDTDSLACLIQSLWTCCVAPLRIWSSSNSPIHVANDRITHWLHCQRAQLTDLMSTQPALLQLYPQILQQCNELIIKTFSESASPPPIATNSVMQDFIASMASMNQRWSGWNLVRSIADFIAFTLHTWRVSLRASHLERCIEEPALVTSLLVLSLLVCVEHFHQEDGNLQSLCTGIQHQITLWLLAESISTDEFESRGSLLALFVSQLCNHLDQICVSRCLLWLCRQPVLRLALHLHCAPSVSLLKQHSDSLHTPMPTHHLDVMKALRLELYSL